MLTDGSAARPAPNFFIEIMIRIEDGGITGLLLDRKRFYLLLSPAGAPPAYCSIDIRVSRKRMRR